MSEYDAVVVGAGPNGLSAAVTLAQQGRSVLVVEGADTVGGGARTAELTLPGFRHDVCSAVHPMGVGSPFLRRLPLEDFGLTWLHPRVPFAHPVTAERAVLVHRSVEETAEGLGSDGVRYRRLFGALIRDWPLIEEQVLGPVLRWPRHPLAMARFGLVGVPSAELVRRLFRTEEAQALVAGCSAHSFLPLTRPLTGAFFVIYPILAHLFGWPVAAGGSQAVVDALAAYLRDLGGEVVTGRPVASLSELPAAKVVMCDLTPQGLARLAGKQLPPSYRWKVRRFRYGPGAYKVDYALSAPVPWANPALADAGTLHLGGTFAEVAAAERDTWAGRIHPRPFTLVAQPSRFDPGRAPEDQHTLWAYAHVPHGCPDDLTALVDAQIERFAPGFRRLVLARSVRRASDWEAYNPNYVGGDIASGAHTLRQVLFRPFPQRNPYATPLDGVYLCSASTPPGAGVHGMCGFWAAQSALQRELR